MLSFEPITLPDAAIEPFISNHPLFSNLAKDEVLVDFLEGTLSMNKATASKKRHQGDKSVKELELEVLKS